MRVIDDAVIRHAVEVLILAAPSGSQVILFGSYAEGTARADSDIDFLVVEPRAKERFSEMVRLSRLLGDMLIPADVIVVSREYFDRYRNTPNTIAYEASRKGTMYEPVS
jgi:uncharacterized protein